MARFAPTRAGIINLWDYRDEEFLFVDGWLVLRGPNGSGKTKALEVLFPFVLDGRIEPRRLNPFAGEDRTMKSNLLYRGQDVAHAYVWMEFGNGSEHVTIGIGLRAHRHNDRVTRWHFVADGRVGVDLSLLDADDRPVSRKELIERLGADAVRDSAEEYRHLVDARLFGLGPARYEQLLDLVLTLRKPQLAKDLNPVELSRTLQRGLRPVEDHLLVEAARSFDDMEAVARTLEGLVAADGATTAFLSVYATYLRTHARAAADAVTARRASVAEHRDALVTAREAAARASVAVSEAADRQDAAEGEPGRLRAHLDRLKGSAAYRSHEQLADLERHVHDLSAAAARALAAVTAEETAAGRRRDEQDRAESESREARAAAGRLATGLAAEAETAGIVWAAADAEPDGLATRLSARAEARRADVLAVRTAADRLTEAERDHARAVDADRAARDAVDRATDDEQQAISHLAQTQEQTAAGVRLWGADHAAVLSTLDLPGLPDALAESLDAPSLRDAYAEAVAAPVAARRDSAAALSAQHDGRVTERRQVEEERNRIAAEHDDAPPPSPTRPAARDGRPGAPLWRLVRFADGVPEAEAAGIEGALEAAGLLDAWLRPDGSSPRARHAAPVPAETSWSGEGGSPQPADVPVSGEVASPQASGLLTEEDAFLRAGPAVAGASLADVLVPEDQDLVPAARIVEVLAGIALGDLAVPAGVTVEGGWAQGAGVGRFGKDRGEYIGATARAARRAARIAECDRRLAALDREIAEIEAARQAVRDVLAAVDRAAAALPSLDGIRQAERAVDRAATASRMRREAAVDAANQLDSAAAVRAGTGAALRRAVADRGLPVESLDATASAVDRFDRAGLRLEHAHTAAGRAAVQAAQAADRHAEAHGRWETAVESAQEARQRHAEKDQELRTLSDAIGAEAAEVLAEVARTEEAVGAAETALAEARAALTEARTAQAGAAARVEMGEESAGRAVAEARQEAVRLRPYAQADLLGLIRCPTDLRWPVTVDGDLDPAVIALHEAILAATRELAPTESSLKQSATRLTGALTELQAQLPAAGLDHRPEWDTDEGVIVVRVADEQGLTPVAHFADRIAAERRDQEQLLTDAEQKVFEDALLGQLAGQIHRRTIEARDLVGAMDTQMRARRMSSGLTVGVGWRLADDLDPEQREVCGLLERDPARLGPGQLTTLRRHFAARIKQARAQAPEKPYRDLLAEVLDYRQWRTFAFALHRPGGKPEPLTRARHSQLSGGEQSVSLHLPLFAAANALFGSARPDAPRLLGLDEAFAGVDDNGRGELMSLAKQFDLDLFMTGYDLWATHPAVTGAAHYDLSHSTVEHAVSTVLLVWDGTMNVADFDGTLARALGSPETRRAAR
ncbi:SbcC/MukB-like Walker B domain-containing protein [Catenuloplanes japonicus]|uniref:SbcC/MukB-like Walker B domain-containing protein n=1 Tax=Catenuloplanes japonicus TaxID=33876 RepID=UPI0005248D4F|nr:SbcC/MukB-like Walker B domain-containing protein [Catenuloplanes japonicus]